MWLSLSLLSEISCVDIMNKLNCTFLWKDNHDFKAHRADTFSSNFLGDVGDGEVFNVQLPQVGELTQLGWKLPNSSITVVTQTKNTLIRATSEKKLTLVWIRATSLLNTVNVLLILDAIRWSIWTEIKGICWSGKNGHCWEQQEIWTHLQNSCKQLDEDWLHTNGSQELKWNG